MVPGGIEWEGRRMSMEGLVDGCGFDWVFWFLNGYRRFSVQELSGTHYDLRIDMFRYDKEDRSICSLHSLHFLSVAQKA
jgi:hypothetical protein